MKWYFIFRSQSRISTDLNFWGCSFLYKIYIKLRKVLSSKTDIFIKTCKYSLNISVAYFYSSLKLKYLIFKDILNTDDTNMPCIWESASWRNANTFKNVNGNTVFQFYNMYVCMCVRIPYNFHFHDKFWSCLWIPY